MAKKRVFQASHIQKELGGKKILSDVSLVMEEGGVYCLMGPSGIGKTTLLSILMGLMKPDKGTLAGFSGARISAVFQEDRLLEEENAVENVALVCDNKADRTKAEALLSELLPGERWEKPVGAYSGGMKRRVALCRAVAHPSDLLLLDEPFTGLDRKSREMAAAFLLRHRNGRTVLAVTHQPEDVQLLGAEVLNL